ncbi:MAG: hypothetical protein EOP06_01065 [Proteobacteria bacterium]|nr:MAG: hypothetical protein EOP06_01065 [Pseudomonadota bacterium]
MMINENVMPMLDNPNDLEPRLCRFIQRALKSNIDISKASSFFIKNGLQSESSESFSHGLERAQSYFNYAYEISFQSLGEHTVDAIALREYSDAFLKHIADSRGA